MLWASVVSAISIAADLATTLTAVGLWMLFRQVRSENRSRAKESSQAVWDLLGAADVYESKLYLECHAPPEDFAVAMRENTDWNQAAMKCYLAYTKASILVRRHRWMTPRDFAIAWGYPTLVVWKRLEPWCLWYQRTRSYRGFGSSIKDLAALVGSFDDDTLEFDKHLVDVLAAPDALSSGTGGPAQGAESPTA